MITKFSCHNFRNINKENLEFEKINILIGPNNSGKTNFIKAITFFSEMLKNAQDGNLKSAFLISVARNGWEHALYKHAQKNATIDFVWEITLNGIPVRYKFSYGVGNAVENCNIVLEELNSGESSGENAAAYAESSFTADEPTQRSTAEEFPGNTSSIQ